MMSTVLIHRVTRVKGASVDYMDLLESQDPLDQRLEINVFYCGGTPLINRLFHSIL